MSYLPEIDTPAVNRRTVNLSAPIQHVKHVLIADANAESRERLEDELRAAGCDVSVARTGFEAIVKASCRVPDLILLYDSLDDLDAAETRRLITTCPVTAHIPVISLSRDRQVPQQVFSLLRRAG